MNKIQQIKMLFKVVFGVSVALLFAWCINLHKQNKKLSESLQTAKNNMEMYQNTITGAAEQNNILKLTIDELLHSNDSLLQAMDENMAKVGIKPANLNTAATQTQSLHVKGGKGVESIIEPTITVEDSIKFNDETCVYYMLKNDSINIELDITNSQYLYVYKHKEWKNNKNFFKRLFTLDFKKVWKESYVISNSNDLINTSDVRVVEITK